MGAGDQKSSPLLARLMVYPLNPHALKMLLERPGLKKSDAQFASRGSDADLHCRG